MVSVVSNEKCINKESKPAHTASQDGFDGRVARNDAVVGAVALVAFPQPQVLYVRLRRHGGVVFDLA